jgi:hypothetical protein
MNWGGRLDGATAPVQLVKSCLFFSFGVLTREKLLLEDAETTGAGMREKLL